MDPKDQIPKRLSMKSIWVEKKWPCRPRELSVGSSAMARRRESHGTPAGRHVGELAGLVLKVLEDILESRH